MRRQPALGDDWLADNTRAPGDSLSPCVTQDGGGNRGPEPVWLAAPSCGPCGPWPGKLRPTSARHTGPIASDRYLPAGRAAQEVETGVWGKGRLGVSNWPQHPADPGRRGAQSASRRLGHCRLSVASCSHQQLRVQLPRPLPCPHPAGLQAAPPPTRDRWGWEHSPLEVSFRGAQATCLPVPLA